MLMATRICASLDIFSKLASDGRTKSAAELAAPSGAEPRLVGKLKPRRRNIWTNHVEKRRLINVLTLERFMKHLVTGNIIEETGPGLFKANAVTELYATPGGNGIIEHMCV